MGRFAWEIFKGWLLQDFRYFAGNTFNKTGWTKCYRVLHQFKNLIGKTWIFETNRLHVWDFIQLSLGQECCETQRIKICVMFLERLEWYVCHCENTNLAHGTVSKCKIFLLSCHSTRTTTDWKYHDQQQTFIEYFS